MGDAAERRTFPRGLCENIIIRWSIGQRAVNIKGAVNHHGTAIRSIWTNLCFRFPQINNMNYKMDKTIAQECANIA